MSVEPSAQREYPVEIEILARMWAVCDPNRGETDASLNEPIPIMMESHVDQDGVPHARYLPPTPLTGKPRWHWFVPRAERTLMYLRQHGLSLAPIEPEPKKPSQPKARKA